MKKVKAQQNSTNGYLLQYKKLQMLKKVFFIDDNEEVSEIMLLEKARANNQGEFYLISYLIDLIMDAPKALKEQFNLLNNKDEEEKDKIKNLLMTNQEYKKFANKVFKELDLSDFDNFKICNMVIFGLCSEIITSELSPENFCLNLYILEKWLEKQQKIDLSALTELEQKVVIYLANGYTPQNLIYKNEFGISNERMIFLIYDVLPARCGVQSICQAIAVLFMNNPNLRNIENSIQMFEKLF